MGTEEMAWTDNEANNGKVGFKGGRTSREKKLRIAVIVLAPLVVILLIALIVLVTLGATTVPKVCTSANCVKTASALLDSLNLSVDPCDDFYQFSCGNWIAAHQENYGVILLNSKMDESMKTVASFMDKELDDSPHCITKLMKAYSSCTEYSGMDDTHKNWIFKYVNSTNGWPMVLKNWKGGKEHWTSLYIKHFKMYMSGTFIEVGVMTDPKNTEENVISILQPSTSSLKEYDMSTIIEFIEANSNQDNATIEKDIEIMKNLKQYMINISRPHEELMADENEAMLLTIGELQKIFPSVSWVQFLKNCFQEFMTSTNFITSNTKVYLLGKSYVQEIIEKLENGIISKREFINYAASNFVNDLIKYYPPEVGSSELKVRRRRRSSINNLNKDRWQDCMNYLFDVSGPAIDYIYVKHWKGNFIEESMVDYMFAAMKDMVDQSTWLDKPTKSAVQEKLKAMTRLIGFPPWVEDVNQLEDFFKDFPEITDSTFENKLNIDRFAFSKSLSSVFIKNDRKDWPKSPDITSSQVNAYYVPLFNMIIVPAAIQILPYFSADRPAYMNFGGMGLIFGHEITHGLDKEGSKRDKYGNLRNWWTETAKDEFDKRAQCFVDQYNAYDYGNPEFHVDGEQTLSENIADNGGVRQAFVAYQKWEKDHGKEKILPGLEQFNGHQLFFMSFASSWCNSIHPPKLLYYMHKDDEHSSSTYRVLGSLKNMKEFADTFKCKEGSPMNPKKKCVIW